MNTINSVYRIMIENFDEEFEIIDETTFLEDAMLIAKNYGKEKYKVIWIEELDKYGNLVKEIEAD